MYPTWQNRAWTNSLPLPTDWKGPVQTSRASPTLLWVLSEFVSYVAESRGHYTQSPNHTNSACAYVLIHAQLFATPQTVTFQAFCLWDFPSKNTGVGCHVLLQGIFPT